MLSRPAIHFVRIPILLASLAGAVGLFVWSADRARSQPYQIRASDLSGWKVVVDEARGLGSPVVSLAAPPELPMRLFRQIFTRAAESLNHPARPGIPLALAGELAGAPGVTPARVVELAREVGLDNTSPEPLCLAYFRESAPRVVRQLYVLAFDLPGFDRFRQRLGEMLREAGGGATYDAAAFSPTMIAGASDEDYWRWMPLVVDLERDCKAPVSVE